MSPITGRVGLRLVDPGNYLQPSDATGIVVITQIDPISVVFSTPEDNLPRIGARLNAGAKLPVTVFDRANVNQLATGTLTTYDSQVDVTTGTIKMRATFDNPNGVLFPQQFVNVLLLVDTLTGVALRPMRRCRSDPRAISSISSTPIRRSPSATSLPGRRTASGRRLRPVSPPATRSSSTASTGCERALRS